ncbi:espin [Folsomia candida]|uniref:espin n=1 Tax=Folsomia candida TaxID=158441 RepID=UPI000B8EFD5E|nr:espin [Folsomia candida]XP_035705536.1 espin [Folsomia candida]
MPSVTNTNPMEQAVARGCVECIRMLLETPPFYSVDACCGADGLRPIHIAATQGHIQALRFLSSAGACLQRSDALQRTALHHAASAGQLRAVRWLLRHGAKILLDKRGRSPIQVAADHDYMEIVNVLAKHATSSPLPSVINSSNNDSTDNDNCESQTSRRSTTQTSEKDTTSDFITGIVDDYSFSDASNHNLRNHHQQHKPFSHLHVERENPDKITSSSPGDCASSSGNSSLSASTSAPSLSPSSSSAVSCGCSTSDETTLVKSDVSDTFTLADYQTSGTYGSTNSLIGASPNPFYLHPPSVATPTSPVTLDFGNSGAAEVGKGILKKSNHKRQGSTVTLASSSPFFLHPPENLVSETQKVVVGKGITIMAPAPVNSSHSHHHHFADPCNESTPKLKVGLAESSSSSSTSSPPQTPPAGSKTGMSTTISECISKFQTEKSSCKRESPNGLVSNNNRVPGGDTTKLKNQVNANNMPPPPPPPPPMPPLHTQSDTTPKQLSCPLPNIPKESEMNKSAEPEPENDYEDIEELTNGKIIDFEQTRKLLRSVSSPPLVNENSSNGHGGGTSEEKSCEESSQHVPLTPTKPSVNPGKVPFIPPHFPTPPQDALIKPSEYLRSIQNKSKSSQGTLLGGNHGNTKQQNSARVEETMKALGVVIPSDNSSGLLSVPEETNAEDEFEEINPERINGFVKMNRESNGSTATSDTIDENNNTTNGNSSSASVASTNKIGCGMIKAEELMKVHLRKTPMSRTKSAPPLGRVIPDADESDASSTCGRGGQQQHQENGHEPLKRTSTMSPTACIMGGGDTVSKADVIAELAESSSVGGVREWKEELKRRQKEQEKAVQKEIEQLYQPVNFVSEVPSTDMTGVPIPDWKRQMMARKAAERARKEAEEVRRMEVEKNRLASIPMWRRQLLQRRESDAKYAQ